MFIVTAEITLINLSPERRTVRATMHPSSWKNTWNKRNLHRRLIATARSLKKQKQRLKAAQDTLNCR